MALIFAFLSIFTLGLLSPVALFLSILELRQPVKYTRSIVAISISGVGLMILLLLALAVLLFVLGMRSYQQAVASAAPGAIELGVITQKWQHTSVYPGPDGVLWTVDDIKRPGELIIPEQTTLHLSLHSDDVIHSLYIPAAQVKVDAVPGRENRMAITPMAVGQYDFFCTEYCGQGHSTMIRKIYVVSDQDYQAHLQQAETQPSP